MTILPTSYKGALCIAALLCAVWYSRCSHADGLTGDVGAGVAYQPHDPSGSRYDYRPIPYLDLSWGRIALSSDRGLSWNALQVGNWSVGPYVNYLDGRNANGSLRGLRDVSDMGQAGGFIEYSPSEAFRVFAEAGRTFGASSGQGGMTGRLGSELDYPLGGGVFGGTLLALHYADAELAQTFFGVSNEEAQASGLHAYNASGGLQNVSLTQSVAFPLTSGWSLVTSASWLHLEGSSADSSIVRDLGRINQGEADVAVIYHMK